MRIYISTSVSASICEYQYPKKNIHPYADIRIRIHIRVFKTYPYQYSQLFQNPYLNSYANLPGCEFYISESAPFADTDADICRLFAFIYTPTYDTLWALSLS